LAVSRVYPLDWRVRSARLNKGNEMRKLLLAAAGGALLAYAPAAWAQMDTGADSYRRLNRDPTVSYGASGTATPTPGARDGDGGWFSGLTVISPNDPTYSYNEPPHAGQSSLIELNGDDHGRGTSYPAILGHDSGM
jgi:hypothetical protein